MKKVITLMLAFVFIFGITFIGPASKASAAETTKKSYTYIWTVKKSNSQVYTLKHTYNFDLYWPTPQTGWLHSTVYVSAKTNGYVELKKIVPTTTTVWPLTTLDKDSDIYTGKSTTAVRGLSTYSIGHALVGYSVRQKDYIMDVTVKKLSADSKNTKLQVTFSVR